MKKVKQTTKLKYTITQSTGEVDHYEREGTEYKMTVFCNKLRRGHEVRVELLLCSFYLPGAGTSKKKVKRFALWADKHYSKTMETVTLEGFLKDHYNIELPSLTIDIETNDSTTKTK